MSSAEWKKKNYNRKIKVSEATIRQIRKGTKATNVKKANTAGASAEFKEGVRRFYGKNTVKDTAPAAAPAAKKVSVPRQAAPVTGGNKTVRPAPSMVQPKKKSNSGGSARAAAGAVVGTAVAAAGANKARAAAKRESLVRAQSRVAVAKKSGASPQRVSYEMARYGKKAGLATKGEVKEAKTSLKMYKAGQKALTAGNTKSRVSGAKNKMRSVGSRIAAGRNYRTGKRS